MKSVSSLDSLLKERIFLGWYIMFSLALNRTFTYLGCSSSSVTETSFIDLEYRKVTSYNTSRLEAHAGFFKWLKGISTPDFSTPDFLNHGVEKFMVEKSGVEKSEV